LLILTPFLIRIVVKQL